MDENMTREEYREQNSNKPEPKVIAAGIGAGVGTALGDIIVYAIESLARIDIPGNVEVAIGIVVAAGVAFVSGYYKKN